MILSISLAEIIASRATKDAEENETYIVITDADETARTVRRNTNPDLPKIGDVDDNGLTVLRVEVRRDRDSKPSGQVFYYSVTWGTPEFSAEFIENPLDRDPEIVWEGLEFSVVETKDAAGTPYRNSVGDLYHGIPERPIGGGSCVITRNEAGNPANLVTQYSFTSNSDAFYGVAAKIARMGKITARLVREQGYTFWQLTYPIDFRRDNWRYKAIDLGFNYLSGGVKKRFLIKSDGADVPSATPSLLDGAGAALSVGAAPVEYPTGGFVQYTETAWAPLALPDPFA